MIFHLDPPLGTLSRLANRFLSSRWTTRGIVAALTVGVCALSIAGAYFFTDGPIFFDSGMVANSNSLSKNQSNLPQPGAAQPRSFGMAVWEFENNRIKGAPFSAQLTIEAILLSQGGPDKPTTKVYQIARDFEGRVRREEQSETLSNIAEMGKTESVMINDFVADLAYVLEPRLQLARVSRLKPGGEKNISAADINKSNTKVDNRYLTLPQGDLSKTLDRSTVSLRNFSPVTKEESLGKKDLEGVTVAGTKTTTTIPAGAVGNPKEISITEERWYSPELQIMVLIRHSDPRFGDSLYRLTNISRNEPAAHLFVIPSGYKTKE